MRSDWLIFGWDKRSVDFFSLPRNSKPHETQKVETNALKSLLKAKYSFKRLLFLRLSFTDNLEDDKEYEHSPSEFYYPDEDLDETSIEASRISTSQEEIEGFINNQKSANATEKTTTDMNTLFR